MIQYQDKEFYNTKDLALSVVGGRWKIAIIWSLLHNGTLRLSEFNKILPDINQRMLIRQLRELERDQIIARTVYPVVPPKVEYHLTDIGKELAPVVQSICDWGDQYLKVISEEQPDA